MQRKKTKTDLSRVFVLGHQWRELSVWETTINVYLILTLYQNDDDDSVG